MYFPKSVPLVCVFPKKENSVKGLSRFPLLTTANNASRVLSACFTPTKHVKIEFSDPFDVC